MTANLWSTNHPRNFWLCQPDPDDEVWQSAILHSLGKLEVDLKGAEMDLDTILADTLGEARFGPEHWTLSRPKKIYYYLKPILPRVFTRILRRFYHRVGNSATGIRWPIEPRYVSFLWAVLARVLTESPGQKIRIRSIWPDNKRYALVLTHDVEASGGMEYVRSVADMEESLGFRSSFNFVPEGYPIDMNLVRQLQQRGFEVGLHGLKHDGKLFDSCDKFGSCAVLINQYLKDFGAVGFRSPLTHRNPYWMQSLEIDYDLSFFDTDPFEPISGGTMSIWPFFIGRFVELPYTLVQDCTLTSILGETTAKVWLEKVDYLEANHGMVLVNSHPDYLKAKDNWDIYFEFLTAMKERSGYWHALPRDVATWWRTRATDSESHLQDGSGFSTVSLEDGNLKFDI